MESLKAEFSLISIADRQSIAMPKSFHSLEENADYSFFALFLSYVTICHSNKKIFVFWISIRRKQSISTHCFFLFREFLFFELSHSHSQAPISKDIRLKFSPLTKGRSQKRYTMKFDLKSQRTLELSDEGNQYHLATSEYHFSRQGEKKQLGCRERTTKEHVNFRHVSQDVKHMRVSWNRFSHFLEEYAVPLISKFLSVDTRLYRKNENFQQVLLSSKEKEKSRSMRSLSNFSWKRKSFQRSIDDVDE